MEPNLQAFRDIYRRDFTPIFESRRSSIRSAGERKVSTYRDIEKSTTDRYQAELDRLTNQERADTTSEIGKVEANAAAAGAEGGVVTANRLMVQKALADMYGGRRATAVANKGAELDRVKALIGETEADTLSRLSDLDTEQASTIEGSAVNAYQQALDKFYRDREFALAQENARAERAARQAALGLQARELSLKERAVPNIGEKLSADEKTFVSTIPQIQGYLDTIKRLAGNKGFDTGGTANITALAKRLFGVAPKKDVNEFNAAANNLGAMYRKLLSGTAVSDKERKELEKLLPNIGQKRETIMANVNQLERSLQDRLAGIMSINGLGSPSYGSQYGY